MPPAGVGMVKFSIRPTGTFCAPTNPIMPAKLPRTTLRGASQTLGRGIACARSRKAFTIGSRGMEVLKNALRPHHNASEMFLAPTPLRPRAKANLMDRDDSVGIDAAAHNV